MECSGEFEKIVTGVYLVGGPEFSHSADCLVYALDLGQTVLIDCGAGPGWPRIKRNLLEAGLRPENIHTLILTHAHIDHAGAAARVKRESGCRVVAHSLDAPALEKGDDVFSAADLYGMELEPVTVDLKITGDVQELTFPRGRLSLLHTPGHTPGSMSVFLQVEGQKILFGQDIHGPFSERFGSDIDAWRRSMQKLLELQADILCEGHFGVFRSASRVRRFIENQLATHP